jgi:hypothetical protein
MRAVLICLFLVACATSQGGGQAKAEVIALRIEAAEKVLTDPQATPEQKAKARADLSHAARDARELGKQADANHEAATDAQADVESLKKWRFYALGGLALAGAFAWFKLKS